MTSFLARLWRVVRLSLVAGVRHVAEAATPYVVRAAQLTPNRTDDEIVAVLQEFGFKCAREVISGMSWRERGELVRDAIAAVLSAQLLKDYTITVILDGVQYAYDRWRLSGGKGSGN